MDETELQAALDRLLRGAASDDDVVALRTALSAGQIVIGSGNVTAGRDIVDSNILQVASAEAMDALLARLYPRRINTLPPPPADFTGRAAQLERIDEAASQAPVLISSIRGLGGVGKTSLALEVARRRAPRHPDAALYLNLGGASEAPLSIREAQSQVIHAFDLTLAIPNNDRELADLYIRTLAGKSGLLVLDDARNPSQAGPLLPPSGWTTIVTSRQHFALPGAGDPINLDAMTEVDALLFITRIVVRLTDAEANEIARLCGRLPLALRLAGSFLQSRSTYSATDYIRRLTDEARRIEQLDAALPLIPEQIGIEATLQLSYDLLTTNLQERLCQLAVFEGGFDTPAVAAVWSLLPETSDASPSDWEIAIDQADDILGSLSNFSLVDAERASRYRLHDLVRLFVSRRLTDDEHDAAELRHAAHYASRLLAAADQFSAGGDGVSRGLALVDSDWTDIRKGQAWAASRGQEDDATAPLTIDYAVRPANILELRLHPRERIAWLDAALMTARRLGDPVAERSILGNLGTAYFALGEAGRAIDYYRQSLAQARDMGSQSAEAGALINLGHAYLILGETDRAIDCFQQALPIMKGIGDRHGEQVAISGLGQAATAPCVGSDRFVKLRG